MKKTKRRLFRLLLSIGAFIVLLVCILMSPLFNVEQIEVRGTRFYKAQDIVEVTNIARGNNWFSIAWPDLASMFLFKSKPIEQIIIKNRLYVKSVDVKYVLAKRMVVISIEEREPILIVPYLGTNLLLDEDKNVIDTVNDVSSWHLPVVGGFNVKGYELGKPLQVDNMEAVRALFAILNVIRRSDVGLSHNNIYSKVTNIDVRELPKLFFVIDKRIMVSIENYNDFNDYKMSFVKYVFFAKMSPKDRGTMFFTPEQQLKFIPNDSGR